MLKISSFWLKPSSYTCMIRYSCNCTNNDSLLAINECEGNLTGYLKIEVNSFGAVHFFHLFMHKNTLLIRKYL